MKKLSLILFCLLTALTSFAKDVSVQGTVVSATDGEPLIGVSVHAKGASTGVNTDFDGNFLIKVPENTVIVFQYVGCLDQEYTAKHDVNDLHIALVDDSQKLDELVVIGYGVQKKSVVTASIAKVSSDDLAAVNPTRVDDALKGMAAGINVTSNSGQPGAGSTIRIRGIGTVNDSNPLYIVDGMPVEEGIAFLDPNDIASIEILKDAASGAVYGSRAANGVILVTTKSGANKERVSVSYNFSYGWQNPWRKVDVLDATEYAIMINEGRINSGMEPIYANPYSYGKGTDWQDLVFTDNAPIMNHQLSISGASEKVDYYMSASYFSQDGIIGGGDWDRSKYSRISVRSNTNIHLFDVKKERNWLSKLDFSSNMIYTHENSRGIDQNSAFGTVLGSAVKLSPILTPYYEDPAAEAAYLAEMEANGRKPVYDKDGRPYLLPGASYNEMVNPLAQLTLPNGKNWYDKFYGNWSADLTIWNNLRFRSTFGLEQTWSGNDGWTPEYYLNSTGNQATYSSVYSSMWKRTHWQTENTLVWQQEFGLHDITVLLGQSAAKTTGRSIGASGQDMMVESDDKANIDATTGLQADGKRGASGGAWAPHTLSSLFARLSYNFDERYMLQFTIRRDGSSNFGANRRYGTFPAVSVGWNITNEKFIRKALPTWWNNAKFRASWGRNGNESIGSFGYISLTATGQNYNFGTALNQSAVAGVKPAKIANADLHWEESEQTDIGLDFAFLSNSVTFSVDYFYKRTKDMLMDMPIAGYVGEVAPIGNVGTMENRGVEFELGYNRQFGDVNVHVSANASYIKNKLINLGNSSGFMTLTSVQSIGEIVRATNGYTYPYFYGYKSDGIFQNMDEVYAYTNAAGEMIQPNAQPGDVRWVDVNGDGAITSDDQDMIGKGTPDWTYGFTIGANWKGLDFSVMCQGVTGNDVYQATRRIDITSSNLPKWMLNRWTGEGSTNKYPRFMAQDSNNWGRSSDLYLTDGSYFRVKNITLGYTLPAHLTKKAFVQSFRVFVMAENLWTATKYSGFDPEVANGNSLGVDMGVYPQSKVWTIGCNLNF